MKVKFPSEGFIQLSVKYKNCVCVFDAFRSVFEDPNQPWTIRMPKEIINRKTNGAGGYTFNSGFMSLEEIVEYVSRFDDAEKVIYE